MDLDLASGGFLDIRDASLPVDAVVVILEAARGKPVRVGCVNEEGLVDTGRGCHFLLG